ncbi:MAG: RraA family protein [Terriglobia bacterium]
MDTPLTSEELESLGRLTSCQVADAIESFDIRLRNEGMTDSTIHCMFPNLAPMVGYAVPARIRTTEPPMTGRAYPDRTDWWNYLLSIPAPRVVVLEDMDRRPGLGSCAGEVHSHIFKALGCVGVVTNGAVRDLATVESIGLRLFAGNVAVSRAYFHMIEFGIPVEVGGLKVSPGTLLHGDRHGIISIPTSVARSIPAEAARIADMEREVIRVASLPNPSADALREALKVAIGQDPDRQR